MALKKVEFTKPKKHPLTYSIIVTHSKSRTIMFHGSAFVKEDTGFMHGDWYDVYFDKVACIMQIQKTSVKRTNTRTMRRMSHKGKVVGGICFSFTGWPFTGFFPKGKQLPLELLKCEPGVLMFRAPRDFEQDETKGKL